MRRKPSGAGDFLQLLDELAQLHALRRGDGKLGLRGSKKVRLDGVGDAVRRHLGAYFRSVRAQSVETAPRVGLDMHIGAFGGNDGHQFGIEHSELAGLELDDDGVVRHHDHAPIEG